jgi:hypothetical protein
MSVSMNRLLTNSPPTGVCIQELAAIIQNADSEPPKATMDVAKRCIPGETRFQPKAIIPRKADSSIKAMEASNPSRWPKISPPGKGAPVGAELKFHGNAADDAHGEIKEKKPHPEPGMMIITYLPGNEPARFHNNQKDAQTDGQNRPDNMEYGRKRELQPGEKNMVLK